MSPFLISKNLSQPFRFDGTSTPRSIIMNRITPAPISNRNEKSYLTTFTTPFYEEHPPTNKAGPR